MGSDMTTAQGPRAWKDCPSCGIRALLPNPAQWKPGALDKPCPTCAAFHAAVDAAKEAAWDEGESAGKSNGYRCKGVAEIVNPYRKGGTR